MKKKSPSLTLSDIADICGIVALPLAVGLGLWLVVIGISFIVGVLARPHFDSWLSRRDCSGS